MFVYKHTETIKYVKKAYFLRKIQTLRENNSRIFRIKKAKLSEYYFYLLNFLAMSDMYRMLMNYTLRFVLLILFIVYFVLM